MWTSEMKNLTLRDDRFLEVALSESLRRAGVVPEHDRSAYRALFHPHGISEATGGEWMFHAAVPADAVQEAKALRKLSVDSTERDRLVGLVTNVVTFCAVPRRDYQNEARRRLQQLARGWSVEISECMSRLRTAGLSTVPSLLMALGTPPESLVKLLPVKIAPVDMLEIGDGQPEPEIDVYCLIRPYIAWPVSSAGGRIHVGLLEDGGMISLTRPSVRA